MPLHGSTLRLAARIASRFRLTIIRSALASILLLLASTVLPAQTQEVPDSLSFQGMLSGPGGIPWDTTVAIVFNLYRNGVSVWSESHPTVTVAGGVFNVILGSIGPNDLSEVSFSEPLDLGIKVGGDPEVTPRIRLLPAPYAMSLRNLRVIPEETLHGPNLIGGWSGNTMTGSTDGATIGGGGDPDDGGNPLPNTISGDYGTIGGGAGNNVDGGYGSVAGGKSNSADFYGSVCGGESNSAQEYGTVCGGFSNSASGSAVVAGGEDNFASTSSSVGGGELNKAEARHATISGGRNNYTEIDAYYSAIGGGEDNRIVNGIASTIAGGRNNRADGNQAAVGGGNNNIAGGRYSAIPGGRDNVASEQGSFAAGTEAHALHWGSFVWNSGVVGTDSLESTGDHQFLIGANGGVGIGTNRPVATLTIRGPEDRIMGPSLIFLGDDGNQFEAGRIRFMDGISPSNHRGAYIHYDGVGNDLHIGVHDETDTLATSDINIITIERTGGDVGIKRGNPSYPLHVGTDASNGNGAHVTDGGTWVDGSSRTFKEDLRPIDASEILHAVVAIPVYRWRYRHSDEGDHMGPVAEDFYETFKLGDDERYIAGVDGDGVALAAIQGLFELVNEQRALIEGQQAEIERMLEALHRAGIE